jgi:hypothetical protein
MKSSRRNGKRILVVETKKDRELGDVGLNWIV